MKIKQALLDMDGVITNFVKGICNLHNRRDPYLNNQNLGLFDMDKIWDIDANTFWKDCGYSFWRTLELMPDAEETLNLLDDLIGLSNVCLLTAPCETAGCIDGKRDWIREHLPGFHKRVFFGSAKEFCSSPTRILIDDRDKNIDMYDGPSFLVPRPWNRANVIQQDWHLQLERVFLCKK